MEGGQVGPEAGEGTGEGEGEGSCLGGSRVLLPLSSPNTRGNAS